jgi:hypothetical protein
MATDGRTPRFPDQVDGWRAAGEPQVFDPETIFSYIDGHAEVYLAYGMRSCESMRYVGREGEGDIVVDVFELASPDDAFGVFTVDLDGEVVPVGHDGRYRYGWLSFWKGPFFVSVYAEEEAEAARNAVFELGHAVAVSIDEDADRPDLVGTLPTAGLDRGSIRFLRSEQILRTHLYLGEGSVAGLTPETSAILAKFSRDQWTAYLLVVDFPDTAAADRGLSVFSGRFLDDEGDREVVQDSVDRWYGARREGSRVALVIGAGTEDLALSLLDETLPGGA